MTLKRSLAVLAAVTLALVALIVLGWQVQATTAQSVVESDGATQLIAELWQRVLSEQTSDTNSNFDFTLEFTDSISGMGNSVTLGQSLTTLRIDRIGADFVCITRLFSQTIANDCVPIHNIAKISYREAR
ncbi:MAG: hypothetical protein JW910_19450 [Anaerolineae bacterium]|nr:hypothetical protein [Anaerolineae bacterium]